MPQKIVLNKLLRYTELKGKEYALHLELAEKKLIENKADLEELDKLKKLRQKHDSEYTLYFENLKKLLAGDGCCFGFSVCHAAMDITGQLNWWECVLADIANWDEQLLSLSEEFKSNILDINKPNTRDKIFERALNYITFNQARNNDHFLPSDMMQSNLLAPNVDPEKKCSHFEIVDPHGKIHIVKKKNKVAGNFASEQLNKLLDEKQIENNIFLVHNQEHTIRVGYKNSKWILYNPNFNHHITPVYQETSDKNTLVLQILCLMDTSLALEIASFNNEANVEFAAFNEFKKMPASILQENGLHILAKHCPELLFDIVKLNLHQNESLPSIMKTLMIKDPDDWHGLHLMTIHAPETLSMLIQIAAESKSDRPALYSILNEALNCKTKQWNGLHTIIRYTPKIASELFKLALDSKDGSILTDVIEKTLKEKNLDNWNGLHLLAKYAPEALFDLFQLVTTSIEYESALTKVISMSLLEKNNAQQTGMQMLIQYAPDTLSKCIEIVLKNNQGLNLLIDIFQENHLEQENTQIQPMKKAFEILLTFIEKLPYDQLIQFNEKIRATLYKKVDSSKKLFFFSEDDTQLWPQLLTFSQKEITKRKFSEISPVLSKLCI